MGSEAPTSEGRRTPSRPRPGEEDPSVNSPGTPGAPARTSRFDPLPIARAESPKSKATLCKSVSVGASPTSASTSQAGVA